GGSRARITASVWNGRLRWLIYRQIWMRTDNSKLKLSWSDIRQESTRAPCTIQKICDSGPETRTGNHRPEVVRNPNRRRGELNMQIQKRRIDWRQAVIGLASGLLLAAGTAHAAVPESEDPIIITLND